MTPILKYLCLGLILLTPFWGQAEWQPKPGQSILLAQNEEAYDPFVDYSEFEEMSEEEADINFFRNGRFFTLGFLLGLRSFTEGLGSLYSDDLGFGLFLSYFFDLRFALQMTFYTGDHDLQFSSTQGTPVKGSVSLNSTGFDIKYYFNTQNVTRGLADLNPYLIGGFSQVSRTTKVTGVTAFGKESAMAFDFGGGIEMPMLRKKMYFGAQFLYQLVNFDDENSELIVNGSESTGIFPNGDILNLQAVIGVNF